MCASGCVLFLHSAGVDEGEQGVLVVQVQLGQQGLDGHFLTAYQVVSDHNQGQQGKEQATVLQQQVLSGKIKMQSKLLFWLQNAVNIFVNTHVAHSDLKENVHTLGQVWKVYASISSTDSLPLLGS